MARECAAAALAEGATGEGGFLKAVEAELTPRVAEGMLAIT
jgi:hypothetical protein